MEKLLNVCYRIENRPLKNKPTVLFLYCSVKIADETQLKIHWQQYLMDTGYSFTEVNYPYLNELYHDAKIATPAPSARDLSTTFTY